MSAMKVFILDTWQVGSLSGSYKRYKIAIRDGANIQSGTYEAIPNGISNAYNKLVCQSTLNMRPTRNGLHGYIIKLPGCIQMNERNPTETLKTFLKLSLLQ